MFHLLESGNHVALAVPLGVIAIVCVVFIAVRARRTLTVEGVFFLVIALGLIGCAFWFSSQGRYRTGNETAGLASLGFAVAGGLAIVASALSKKN